VRGDPGEWDGGAICHPEVYVRGNKLEMWYAGWPSTSISHSSFGLAYSSDGITWVKSLENPIFETAVYGEWDDKFVGAPTVIYEDDSLKLWYSATGYTAPWNDEWNIGLAVADLTPYVQAVQQTESTAAASSYLRVRGPNPFVKDIEFEVFSPSEKVSMISVYNVLGQKVREIQFNGSAGVPSMALWNGEDSEGRTVTSGIYFVLMISGGEVYTQKVIKTK
jgi:hypothetical protein